MSSLWTSKCVLFATDGSVRESGAFSGNHNESIAKCAKSIGLDINPDQAMKSMLQPLVETNNVVLLNTGYDENLKRTGYLALPETIVEEQIDSLSELQLFLDEYESLTVWQLTKDVLKSNYVDSKFGIASLQNLINGVAKEKNNESKI